MSVFTPYQAWTPRLPQLKVGHFFKIGDRFYQIVNVRRNRQRITVSGAKTTDYSLNVSTDSTYESLHGNLEKDRIVHIQYVAVENDGVTTVFSWGPQPLFSKDVKLGIDTNLASKTNPMEIDRWSYDNSMYLKLTQTGTQVYIFECVEYEVKPYQGEPSKYLHLMANGQAVYVEKA